jgi:hypothetical protein
MAGASGSAQSEGWVRAGTWLFPRERIAVMGHELGAIRIWLDAGLVVELTLRDGVDPIKAEVSTLSQADVTALVEEVNVRQW